MSIVRVITPAAVRDPEIPGAMIVLKEDAPYQHDDPVVRAYPWAFAADVEEATARPGQKRSVRLPE